MSKLLNNCNDLGVFLGRGGVEGFKGGSTLLSNYKEPARCIVKFLQILSYNCIHLILRPNKKNCVVPITRQSQVYTPDPSKFPEHFPHPFRY